jgi:hypothetical protein
MGKVYNYVFSYDRRLEFNNGNVNQPVWVMNWKDLNPNKLYKCNYSLYTRHSVNIGSNTFTSFSVLEWNLLSYQASSRTTYTTNNVIGFCTCDGRGTNASSCKSYQIDYGDYPDFYMYKPTSERITLLFGGNVGTVSNFLLFTLRMEEVD